MKAPAKGTVIYKVFGDEITPWTFRSEYPNGDFDVVSADFEVFPKLKHTTPADWFFPTKRDAMLAVLESKARCIERHEQAVKDAHHHLQEARDDYVEYHKLVDKEIGNETSNAKTD